MALDLAQGRGLAGQNRQPLGIVGIPRLLLSAFSGQRGVIMAGSRCILLKFTEFQEVLRYSAEKRQENG